MFDLNVYEGIGYLQLIFFWVGLIVKVIALIDAAIRPPAAYVAADKQTKKFWLILLGVMVAITFVPFVPLYSLLSLAGFIAAAVYLVDVRPAVRQLGGKPKGNNGPYGPW